MHPPSQPAITLAAVQAIISQCKDLSPQRQSELRSAINRFAKICNRSPADIIADPATIRGLAATAPWKLARLSKGSWANVKSLLTKAMALADIKVHRQRRNFKLSPLWEDLLAPMGHRDTVELHRFAGWCSVHDIAPLEVSEAIFNRFLGYLEEQMVQRNPRERCHVARRAWNRTAAAAPNSAYPTIPAPTLPRRRIMRWSDFPDSLRQDVDAYSQRALTKDVFNDKRRHIKPVTLKGYLDRLRWYLTDLVESGVPPEQLTSLLVLVDPDLMKRGLQHRLGDQEPDEKSRPGLHAIATALLSAAAYLDIDEKHRAELKRMAKVVRYRSFGMCQKNKDRLAPLLDEKVAQLLLELPIDIDHELRNVKKPTIRQAQRMQMACLVEILLHVPLRIRNVSELDLAKNISRPVGGGAGRWRISFAAKGVKNEMAIDAEFGEETSALLDRYVEVFRPMLMKDATTALFTSQSGLRKGPSPLSKQLARFVRRETGITINAHLFRHLAAHLYLAANPGDYETTRRLLTHKQINTTVNTYTGTETASAFARHDSMIAAKRKSRRNYLPATRLSGPVSEPDARDVL